MCPKSTFCQFLGRVGPESEPPKKLGDTCGHRPTATEMGPKTRKTAKASRDLQEKTAKFSKSRRQKAAEFFRSWQEKARKKIQK